MGPLPFIKDLWGRFAYKYYNCAFTHPKTPTPSSPPVPVCIPPTFPLPTHHIPCVCSCIGQCRRKLAYEWLAAVKSILSFFGQACDLGLLQMPLPLPLQYLGIPAACMHLQPSAHRGYLCVTGLPHSTIRNGFSSRNETQPIDRAPLGSLGGRRSQAAKLKVHLSVSLPWLRRAAGCGQRPAAHPGAECAAGAGGLRGQEAVRGPAGGRPHQPMDRCVRREPAPSPSPSRCTTTFTCASLRFLSCIIAQPCAYCVAAPRERPAGPAAAASSLALALAPCSGRIRGMIQDGCFRTWQGAGMTQYLGRWTHFSHAICSGGGGRSAERAAELSRGGAQFGRAV